MHSEGSGKLSQMDIVAISEVSSFNGRNMSVTVNLAAPKLMLKSLESIISQKSHLSTVVSFDRWHFEAIMRETILETQVSSDRTFWGKVLSWRQLSSVYSFHSQVQNTLITNESVAYLATVIRGCSLMMSVGRYYWRRDRLFYACCSRLSFFALVNV